MPRVTITVPESTAQPYRFQLDREVVKIGRGSDNDIVVDSGSVSTYHAEMRRILGGYELHDLDSTNGVKLDGERYSFVPLYHGSTVYLGDVAFDFSLTDEEQAVLSEEASLSYENVQASIPPVPISTQPMVRVPIDPRPVPQRHVIRVEEEKSGGFMAALLLIIFAAVAFGIGMAIRHQKDTGGSLLTHIQEKKEKSPVKLQEEAPVDATPTESAPVTPASEEGAQ